MGKTSYRADERKGVVLPVFKNVRIYLFIAPMIKIRIYRMYTAGCIELSSEEIIIILPTTCYWLFSKFQK